jgi:hypothetical protein
MITKLFKDNLMPIRLEVEYCEGDQCDESEKLSDSLEPIDLPFLLSFFSLISNDRDFGKKTKVQISGYE